MADANGDAAAVGGIFQGKKLWLSSRLPSKEHFARQDNGGRIALLEKDADILIADPMRKAIAPTGACSYKLIEDSVSNGVLQLEDRYVIAVDAPEVRKPGSSAPTRRGRVPFSAQDDALLAKWVLSHPDPRTGNILYQKLEAVNDRHTWQSWRNRWSKELSRWPMTKLEHVASQAGDLPELPVEEAPTPPPREAPPRQVQPSPPPPVRQSPPRKARQSPRRARQPAPESPPAPIREEKAQVQQRVQAHHTERPETPEVRQTPRVPVQPEEPERQPTPPPEEEDPSGDAPVPGDEVEEYAIAVAQFTHDIETFASERNLDIDLHPIIDDRRIELYDLGQAAGSQEVDTQDIDWDTVAAELGFSPSQNDVALQLQTCWDVNLAAFLEVMAQHEASSHAGDDDDDDDFQDAPQSPQLLPQQDDRPPSSSSKRPAQEEAPSSRNSKRARLDRNAEIPSTPDHALAVRRHDERVSSPSRRRLFAEVRDSQADSQATLSRPRIEVQVTPRRAPHQSSRDVTPSQQLMQESHFVDAEPSGSPHLGTAAAPTRKAKRRTLPSSFRSPEAQPQWQPASDPPIVVDDDPDAADSFNNPDPVPSPAHAQNSLSTIEDWIDHYESLGYAHDIVIRVLEATTMTPGGPASHAMEALRRGEPLPPNHEGVWTDRDDAALRQVLVAGVPGPLDREPVDEHDARTLAAAVRELSRLEYKHGAERVRLRAQFLEALEQEGELDE